MAVVVAPVEQAFLRQEEAAAYLNISVQTLWRLHKKGEGPPRIRLGIRRLSSIESLKAWALAREGKA